MFTFELEVERGKATGCVFAGGYRASRRIDVLETINLPSGTKYIIVPEGTTKIPPPRTQ
jgi:hypothetical protein